MGKLGLEPRLTCRLAGRWRDQIEVKSAHGCNCGVVRIWLDRARQDGRCDRFLPHQRAWMAGDHVEAQRRDLPAHFGRQGVLAATSLGVKLLLDDQEPWRM